MGGMEYYYVRWPLNNQIKRYDEICRNISITIGLFPTKLSFGVNEFFHFAHSFGVSSRLAKGINALTKNGSVLQQFHRQRVEKNKYNF